MIYWPSVWAAIRKRVEAKRKVELERSSARQRRRDYGAAQPMKRQHKSSS